MNMVLLKRLLVLVLLLLGLLIIVAPGPRPGWAQFSDQQVPYVFSYPDNLDPVTIDTNAGGDPIVRGYGFGFLPLYADDYAAVQAVEDLPDDIVAGDALVLETGEECLVYTSTSSEGATYYCPFSDADTFGVIGIFNGVAVPNHAEVMATLRAR